MKGHEGGYARIVKPVIYRPAAAALLVLLSPLLAALALLVRMRLGSPVIFRQPRPGLHGRTFTLWKFRTMTDSRGPDATLLPDVERVTPFGHRPPRSTSLDELPELIKCPARPDELRWAATVDGAIPLTLFT